MILRKEFLNILVLSTAAVSCLVSCDSTEPKIQGCIDIRSLDFDRLAEEDDGSCTYSRVSFYTVLEPIGHVSVTVDGILIGTITAFYDSEPENCSSQGNVTFQLTDGDLHAWEASFDENVTKGNVFAEPDSEWIIQITF